MKQRLVPLVLLLLPTWAVAQKQQYINDEITYSLRDGTYDLRIDTGGAHVTFDMLGSRVSPYSSAKSSSEKIASRSMPGPPRPRTTPKTPTTPMTPWTPARPRREGEVTTPQAAGPPRPELSPAKRALLAAILGGQAPAQEIARGEFFKWQGYYGAFTIAKPHVHRVRSYVLNQEAHHRTGRLSRELERVSGVPLSAQADSVRL